MRKHLFTLLKLLLVAALFYWLIVDKKAIRWSDFEPVVQGRHWGLGLLVFFMLFLINVVCAYRWHFLLAVQKFGVALRKVVQFFWIGLLFNVIIPGATGGDVMRIYYIWRERPSRGVEAGSTTIFDRVVGLYALVIVAFLAATGVYIGEWFGLSDPAPEELKIQAYGAIIVFFGFSGCMAVMMSRRIRNFGPWKWLREKSPGAHTIERAYEAIQFYRHHLKSLGVAIILSLFIHSVNILALVICSSFMGVHAPLTTHLLVWSMTVLIGAIPITPGGLGVAEAAADKLWLVYGVTSGASIFLMYRLFMVLVSLFGIGPYLYYRKPTGEEIERLESQLDAGAEPEEMNGDSPDKGEPTAPGVGE